MRQSSLFRLPGPVFLIVCIVWLAWSAVSLVCFILIWLLLRLITLTRRANNRLRLRRSERRVSVYVSTPTVTPKRKPAVLVPLPRHDQDMSNLVDCGGISAQNIGNTEREEKVKRLMLALGIKHREFAEQVIDKGYPVGW